MYKLLVVDDEALEREALKYVVTNSGLAISEVRDAANGQEALAIAETFDPDIVTLDIMMPGLNGIEAGRILKERKPGLKIVFVTAYNSFEYAHEAIRIGVEEFIVKPGSDEKTLEILQSCICQLEEEARKRHQRKSLEVKMDQISGYLENEFVNSVVNGEIDEHQAVDYLNFMLNAFTEGFGVVVDIAFTDTATPNHIQRTMIKKRVAQQLASLPDGQVRFIMSMARNTIYILVFGYEPHRRDHYVRLVRDEIQMAGEDLGDQQVARLYFGIGESFGQISRLWKSFAQAKAAARNLQLCLQENADGGPVGENTLEITESELWRSVLNEREDAVFQKADHILDNIIFATSDMKEARLKLYEFFILMSRYLNRESQLKRAVPEDVYDELKTIASKGEARKYIHGYLSEILDALKEQRNSKTPELLDKAILFIEQRYCENLTLEEVAFEIGFSTYYFGKLFKKTIGTTFTDYLTSVRIAHAKEMLRDPMQTVKGITYRVGFMDPNYFTRVFKKNEGLTPTEYRMAFWHAGSK